MGVLILVVALTAVGGWAGPPALQAQQTTAPHPAQSAGDAALVAELTAAVRADTTDFALGHKDFHRYTTPGFCLAAVQHQRTVAQRSIAAQETADTMRHHAMQDTLPTSVAAVARACAAQFPVVGTPAAELPHLFQLALVARQDTLAQAVLTRQLSLAATPSAKAALLVAAESTYLAAAPARVAAAEAQVAQLDSLGAGAAVLPSRLRAHAQLLEYGELTADEARVRQEAAQVLALSRSHPTEARSAELVVETYRALGELAYLRAPDSLRALAQQVQQDAKRMGIKYNGTRSYAELPLDSVVREFSPARYLGEQAGQPLPPVHAAFWFPATDTVVPAHGRPSLVMRLPASCYGSYANPDVLDPIASGCQGLYTQLRKWHAQYGAGLDLTLVVVTSDHGGTVLSGPQTPAEAAQNLGWFFRQYLKLPVQHVAVQVIPVTVPLPEPDGRMFYVDSASDPQAWAIRGGGMFGFVRLTDRNGVVVYGSGALNGGATEFDRLLQVVTAAGTSAPSAPPPAASSAAGVSPVAPPAARP